MGGGMVDTAPTPQPPPAGVGLRIVQEDVAEVVVAEANGDGAVGGISIDTPTPASQSSSPAVVDPPMVQEVCKPQSVKEHVDAQADHRAGYHEVTATEQAVKRADVQSQQCSVQVVVWLQQVWCGRGDKGVDLAEELATHAARCCLCGAHWGECDGAGLTGECLLLPCAQRAQTHMFTPHRTHCAPALSE